MVIGRGRPPRQLSSRITHARLCFLCPLRLFSCTFFWFAASFAKPLDSDPFHRGLWSFCFTSAGLFNGNVLRQKEKRKTALRHLARHDSRSLRGGPPAVPGGLTGKLKKKNPNPVLPLKLHTANWCPPIERPDNHYQLPLGSWRYRASLKGLLTAHLHPQ